MWPKSRQHRTTVVLLCSVLIASLGLGCQATGPVPKRQWNAQPIESFASITGKWAGIMVRTPKSREEDWVRVTIGNDGRYDFTSYRTIGVFSGHGQFSLEEGKLTVTTERGTATGSLWIADDSRMLRMRGVMKDGTEYTAELQPSQ